MLVRQAPPSYAALVARLTAAQRNALPDSAFAGPGRTYPVPDKSHAQFAKAMATRHAPPATKKKIDAKANRVLGQGQPLRGRRNRHHQPRKGNP